MLIHETTYFQTRANLASILNQVHNQANPKLSQNSKGNWVLSPKKKQPKDVEVKPEKLSFQEIFSPEFKDDLAWWYRQDRKKGDRILDLVANVLDADLL